jgi:hypothetical protein
VVWFIWVLFRVLEIHMARPLAPLAPLATAFKTALRGRNSLKAAAALMAAAASEGRVQSRFAAWTQDALTRLGRGETLSDSERTQLCALASSHLNQGLIPLAQVRDFRFISI